MRWLTDNSGIKFKSLYVSQQWNRNEFKLPDRRTIGQKQLMEMLREKFSDQLG
ncbi:MAG: hypothetical protein K6F45_04140 [Saccharofermentans sp.]|nr:hypothetical protein [Saccharofermentans sp.]